MKLTDKDFHVFSRLEFYEVLKPIDQDDSNAQLDGYYFFGKIINGSGVSVVELSQNAGHLTPFGDTLLFTLSYDVMTTLVAGDYTYYINAIKFGRDTENVFSGDFIVYEKTKMLFDETAWDDLLVPVLATKTGGVKDPAFTKVADNGAGSTGVFTYLFSASSEQELFFVVQLPHRWLLGSNIKPHVHWFGTADGAAGEFPRWGLEYTPIKVGDVMGNTVIIKSDASSASTATISGDASIATKKHLISALPEINCSTFGYSTILLCRVFRDATDITDDYASTAGMLHVDFHFRVNGFGSDLEYTD